MPSSIKLRCLDDLGNNIFLIDSLIGARISNTIDSTNSSTGGLLLQGGLSINKTSNSSSITEGGSLTSAGGASFAKDMYIGGSLIVKGQNLTNIIGNTTIGSFSGTGVCEIIGISIGETMQNTNYKIIGNLQTTSNNTNIYTVSFKNITTTTFDAVIYRLDSLGSGWNDDYLKLSWQITP